MSLENLKSDNMRHQMMQYHHKRVGAELRRVDLRVISGQDGQHEEQP